MSPTARTVRELGGEIWAEMRICLCDPQHLWAQMDWRHISPVTDIVMSVPARRNGTAIVNDESFPFTPLPQQSFT
jgi:hypothetical protein